MTIKEQIEDFFKRNRKYNHTANEIADSVNISPVLTIEFCNQLVAEGKVRKLSSAINLYGVVS